MSWFGIAPILLGFVLSGFSGFPAPPDDPAQRTPPSPRLAAEETPAKEGPATVLEYRFEYLPTATGTEKERTAFAQTLEKRLQEQFGSSGWRLSFDAKESRFTLRVDPPADRKRIDAFRKHVETVGQISVHAVAAGQYQEPTVVEQIRQEVAAWEAKCAEARRAGKPLPPLPARLVVQDERGAPLVVAVEDDSLGREDLATFETTSSSDGMPAIGFSTGTQGASKLARLTESILERRGRIAIVVDGRAVSTAFVNSRISSSGIISGNMSLEECNTLVRIFCSGALPAKPILLSETQVERL